MSTSSPDNVPRAAHPWRVRICGVLWKVFGSLGALFLSLLGAWLIGTIPAHSPFVWLFAYWPITLSVGSGLLALAAVIWFYSQEPPSLPITQQNRDIMIRRLCRCYSDLKEQSLQGAAWLELGFSSKPTAVQQTSSLILRSPNLPEHVLPPGTKILDIYDEAGRALLVLGEPGTGKSTLLLELAQHLIERAEKDVLHPFPMIVALSSWAVKRLSLQDWLSEQVALIYSVPRRLSRQWIQEEQILPLLDGLDEVEASLRPTCIERINAYHRQHVQPLVVCSRTHEYEAAATRERLALDTAVVVQPLSKERVDVYLERLGKPLAALRAAVRKNPVLRELATTPLMVQVLVLTYRGVSIRALSQKEAQLREQIWDDYVQRLVERKGDVKRYPLPLTRTWLGWLARQMRAHNQTIFYLEQLQPDWLPQRQRVLYQCSIILLFGLGIGLLTGLFYSDLIGGLVYGLLGGLFFGTDVGMNAKIEPVETLVWSWKGARSGLLIGLLVGLGGWPLIGLLAGLIYSSGELLHRLLFGLGGLVYGLAAGLFWGLVYGLVLGLLRGLSRRQLTKRLILAPNEGMRRSLTYGLVFLLLGVLCGVLVAVSGGVPSGGLLLSWLLLGLLGGLVAGLFFGLRAAVQHYILRLWLVCTHAFPWKAVQFLEDATTRILLRRVGGGYSFVHRLLLEHFAELDTGATPASTAPSPTLDHPPSSTTPSA